MSDLGPEAVNVTDLDQQAHLVVGPTSTSTSIPQDMNVNVEEEVDELEEQDEGEVDELEQDELQEEEDLQEEDQHVQEQEPIPSLEGLIRAAMDAPEGGVVEEGEGLGGGVDDGGVGVGVGGIAGDTGHAQEGVPSAEDSVGVTTLVDEAMPTENRNENVIPVAEEDPGVAAMPMSLVESYMTTEPELDQNQQQAQAQEHHHQQETHEHPDPNLTIDVAHLEPHDLNLNINPNLNFELDLNSQLDLGAVQTHDPALYEQPAGEVDAQVQVPSQDMFLVQDPAREQDQNQDERPGRGMAEGDIAAGPDHSQGVQQQGGVDPMLHEQQPTPQVQPTQGAEHQHVLDPEQQGLLNLQMHIDGTEQAGQAPVQAGEYPQEDGGAGDVRMEDVHEPAAGTTLTAGEVEGDGSMALGMGEQVPPEGTETVPTDNSYLGAEEAVLPTPTSEAMNTTTGLHPTDPPAQTEVGLVSSTLDPMIDQTMVDPTAIPEIPLASSSTDVANATAATKANGKGRAKRTISSSASAVSGLKIGKAQIGAEGQGDGHELPDALVGKTREEIDDIKRRIVDRLESLLSATALPHDKLLFSLSLRNTSGWIPLSTVAKYPKIRSYADTYGLAFVAESVRDANDSREDGQEDVPVPTASNSQDGTANGGASANGGQVEETAKREKKVGPAFLGRGRDAELVVDGKGERVRRKEVMMKADTAWDRTVYAEGFGILDPSTTTTQDAIEEWFEQFAPITVVRFRRGRDPFGGKGRGDFRGSVFCEFRTVEGADLFLRTNPKPLFNGTEIVAMFKETYLESRIQLKALRHSNVVPIEQIEPDSLFAIDKSLLKLGNKKRKREEEEENAAGKRTTTLYILFNKHRVAVSRKTGTVINKNELVYPDRALLKFTGAGETGDWKLLKEDLVNAEIEHSFLYLPRRSTVGYFAAPEAIGDEVVERLRNLHLIVGDSEIEWERVEGQEERDFYAKRASFQGKLAVKMADEKENLELDAVKETAKELRSANKERARGKSMTGGSNKKKRSGSSSVQGNASKKGKTEDEAEAMLAESMQMDV
ncbi:hypothetical protein FFLO_01337 [Filobasidium floriforme]|uniref:HTH La-type RNA-binding domain-containing protein n=1 Tax=Filobasidium floriforme TaxID=5210 RepID=A0A8K0JQ98_9TREE|nr:hypothetical protein FFLO_01337 [Filobasidium floriforme]